MARPVRLEFGGALYHVTARGDRREAIYRRTVSKNGVRFTYDRLENGVRFTYNRFGKKGSGSFKGARETGMEKVEFTLAWLPHAVAELRPPRLVGWIKLTGSESLTPRWNAIFESG